MAAREAADLLFCLAESGFDLSAGTVEFNDLLDRQGQVGSHQGDPLSVPIHPDHPYRTRCRRTKCAVATPPRWWGIGLGVSSGGRVE